MTYPKPRNDGDFQAHRQLAHDRLVAHLEVAIDEANAAIGWLKAWPHQLTNAEENLERVVTTLRVELRRIHPDAVAPSSRPEPDPHEVRRFDASGDLVQR